MQTKLPDVREISVPDQRSYGEAAFPLVFQNVPGDAGLPSSCEWLANHQVELDAKATKHGAILFRGFPVRSPEDFDAFIAAMGYPNFPYEQSLSNAVRVVRTERVFSANEAPPDVTIFFHHEMAQTPIYPSKLFFYCEHAADEGGATPLCRSDVLLEQLRGRCPQFVENCENKGLKYSNVMPAENDPGSGMGRSWRSTLRAEQPPEAESRLRELGYSWEWLPDECLRATTPVLPAVREVSPGRKTFFNQLIAAFKGWKDVRNDPSKSITFGDGSPLDADAVHTAAELADELSFDVAWQSGDVALVDNFVTMHGRRSFAGVRKVWASLVAHESTV